jgi:hypothetical protein
MTDELTDAVRRLKELQADVERLKAGDDQRGVPRLLFSQSETGVASDRTDTRSRDVISVETGVASDRQSGLILRDISVETGVASDRQSGLILRDLQQSDVAEARDAQTDLRKQRTVEDGFYNAAGYNVATIDPQVTIVRTQQSETGVASDRIDIRSRDLQQSETGVASDRIDIRSQDLQQSETGVASDRIDIRSQDLQQSYNSAGYNTATYG